MRWSNLIEGTLGACWNISSVGNRKNNPRNFLTGMLSLSCRRYKRETGNVLRLKENSSLEMDQSKPAAFEIHNEDVPYDAETSSRVPQRNKRSSNRMLHFGKREGYDTEGENMQDHQQDGVKRATNKMLHFGKRMEDDTSFGAMEEAYRDESNAEKRSSNRILHFGKRKPEVTPVGVPLGYGFQSPGIEEKRSNRILHFGKREPELPGGGEPLLSDFERPGSDEKRANRILHFGKRMGVDEYPAAVSYADLYKKMETKRGPQGHRILHFGKREEGKSSSFFEDDDEAGEANRPGNKMLNIERRRPFGSSAELRDQLQRNFVLWKKRSSNRMLHFGKRQKIFDEPTNAIKDEDYSNVSNEYNEAGNVDKRFKDSMLHFGKRGNDPFPRTQNRIMHFGKRGNEFNLENSPEIGKNPGDRLLSYEQGITHLEGIGGTDKHSQYRDARSQTPSLENVPSGSEGQKGFLNDSGTPGGRAQSTRTKRSIVNTDNIDATLERVLTDLSNAGYAKRFAFGSPGLLGTLHLPHAVVAARDYGSILPPRMLSRPSRSDRIPVTYSGQHGDKPKGASRNVFLHFG